MKPKKCLIYNAILSIGLIVCSGCTNTRRNINNGLNFPYSILSSLSYLKSYKELLVENGEPDITLQADNFTYYIWDVDVYKKLAIVRDGSIVYYFSVSTFQKYETFVNQQVKDFNDIQKIDPYAKIADGDMNSVSDHLLVDGTFLHIIYEKQENTYVIKETSTFPSGFPDFSKIVAVVSEK